MFFELPSLASEPLNNKSNETVSAGHTAISPHTLEKGWGGGKYSFLGSQNSKCQVLANF